MIEWKTEYSIVKTSTLELKKVTGQTIKPREIFQCFQLTRHQTTKKAVCEDRPNTDSSINPKAITKPKITAKITKAEKIPNPIGTVKLEVESQDNKAISIGPVRANENQTVSISNVVLNITDRKDCKTSSAITKMSTLFTNQDNATINRTLSNESIGEAEKLKKQFFCHLEKYY